MALILNESLVLAKTRSQDLKSVLKLNCWGSGIKDVSLVRQLINVEVIGLSCNEITTLEDFAYCSKLRELILRKNKISNIAEVAHLQALPKLTSLWLDENPCAETTYNYRKVVLKALPNLTILDNKPVTREELQEIEELGNEIYEEIPYESSTQSISTTNSGPSSGIASQPLEDQASKLLGPVHDLNQQGRALCQDDFSTTPISQTSESNANAEYTANDFSYQNTSDLRDTNYSVNDSRISISNGNINFNNTGGKTQSQSRASGSSQQISKHSNQRHLYSQESVSSFNVSQNFACSDNNNSTGHSNNNNNSINNPSLIAKGTKTRNPNILSAVLCLIKELDYFSCEVVQTALHCRMEETTE